MAARDTRLPYKLISMFRAMLVVLQHYPLSLQPTLYYPGAVLNAAMAYKAMHLPYNVSILCSVHEPLCCTNYSTRSMHVESQREC